MIDFVRIAIVDAHPLFREGVINVFSPLKSLKIVGQGACCADGIRIAVEVKPDILLLGCSACDESVDAVRCLSSRARVTRTVVLSECENERFVAAVLNAGARGYFLKSEQSQALVHALQSVKAGQSYVTPTLAAGLFEHMKRRDGSAAINSELRSLTRRETEILYCVGLGLTNKSIASRLGIREKTVKHYMTNVMQKLKVSNRVQAALIAQTSDRDGTGNGLNRCA